MPSGNNESNLNNETPDNDIKGVPDLPGAPEDKSSSIPYDDPPRAGAEDIKTGEAVDDIARRETDELLAVEDAKRANKPEVKKSWRQMFKKKKVAIPLLVLLVLILVCAVPASRYKIFGIFWKQNYKLVLDDTQTGKPVSDALVSLDGKTATTNNQGQAALHVAVGHHTITITKKYYKSLSENTLIGLRVNKTILFPLQATGRQVPVSVINKITDQPIADALIKLAGTEGRTDKDGQLTIVLPANDSSIKGSISATGYNDSNVAVQVTTKTIAANNFTLTPSGQIYFLSNVSGNIDVLKANLDGSSQQTVLPGTGSEDPNNTSLLASRDWQYLALQSRRSGSKASLYLITTNSDKLSVIDSGNADFTPVGWDNHYFIYDVTRDSLSNAQPGQEEIKSYNADTGRISVLDQSQVKVTDGQDFYTSFSGLTIMDNELSYLVQWFQVDSSILAGKTGLQDVLKTVLPTGGSQQTRKSFAYDQTNYLNLALYDPNDAYIEQNMAAGNNKYYSFDGSSVSASSISQQTFDKAYPTFLLSPSGSQTFWDEQRDGKNTLFVGSQNAGNSKQIASLSDYVPYGWYGDSYLLLSKGGNELYVTTPARLAANATPLKVADYYSSDQQFVGYGGGYGGL